MLIIVIALTLLLFLMNNDGSILRQDAPNGQHMYMLSKLMGILALALLWWQVFVAVLGRIVAISKTFHAGKYIHILLGTLLLGLVLSHAGLFFTAVSQRTGSFAWGALLPDFTSGYYASARSLGVVALALLLVAVIMPVFRGKLVRTWRTGHLLVLFVTCLVLIHAYLIGSEVRSVIFMPLFWGMLVTLAVALCLWCIGVLRR